MKIKILLCIVYFLLFPYIIPMFFLEPLSHKNANIIPILNSQNEGVSNFNITQSVTYEVEIDFSLTHKGGLSDYNFKIARLNNRTPYSQSTKFTPPYQESILLSNEISGYKASEIKLGHHDRFNNTYDSFNASPFLLETVTYHQKYEIILNAIKFNNIEVSEIGMYDMTDEMFVLYCNHSELYYEKDDPTLIALSNSIIDLSDNPIEKANKICNWVSENLEYNDNLPAEEKGALWAYNNLQGDCSEYSSLMITLLRIQGIPARKVTGFLISNNPLFKPRINKTYSFHESYSDEYSSNVLRHAWVEYYVPLIGWIACDPTWNKNNDYFNNIDYLRFNLNVGAHFFVPPSLSISEFSNPSFSFNPSSIFEFTHNIDITVIDIEQNQHETSSDPFPFLPIIIIVGVFSVAVTVLVIVLRKSSKKGFDYNNY